MPRQRLHPAPNATPPKHKPGPAAPPSEVELAKRRQKMMQLVVMGGTPDEIQTEMRAAFPAMSEQVVRKLHREVRDALEDTARETIIMDRAKQKRRLHGWIAQAVKDRDWSAVASLENTYSRVAGTASPITVNHNHATEATRSALERTLAAMGEEQARRLLAGEEVSLGAPEIIETTAEPVPVQASNDAQ
jgi:hypothetical protein